VPGHGLRLLLGRARLLTLSDALLLICDPALQHAPSALRERRVQGAARRDVARPMPRHARQVRPVAGVDEAGHCHKHIWEPIVAGCAGVTGVWLARCRCCAVVMGVWDGAGWRGSYGSSRVNLRTDASSASEGLSVVQIPPPDAPGQGGRAPCSSAVTLRCFHDSAGAHQQHIHSSIYQAIMCLLPF
jgi:hypothetical protein